MTNSDPFDFSRFRPDLTEPKPAGEEPFGTTGFEPDTSSRGDGAPLTRFDGTGFDGDGFRVPSATAASTAHPPVLWLAAAIVAAGIGIAVAASISAAGSLYLISWALAGPLAIGLIGVHSHRDTIEQAKLFYALPSWAPWAYRVAVLLAGMGIFLNAWRIADWVGHR